MIPKKESVYKQNKQRTFSTQLALVNMLIALLRLYIVEHILKVRVVYETVIQLWLDTSNIVVHI